MDTNEHESAAMPANELMPWEPVDQLTFAAIDKNGREWTPESRNEYRRTVIGHTVKDRATAKVMISIRTGFGPAVDVALALALLTGLLNPELAAECERLAKLNGELGDAMKKQTVLLWALCKTNSSDGSMYIDRRWIDHAPADGRLVKSDDPISTNIMLKAEDGPGLILM